jgi:hypothetical protein
MNKAYLIPLAMGLALGYTAGEWDIYEVNAKSITHSEVIEATLDAAGIAHVAAIINDNICPEAVVELGISPAKCTPANVKKYGQGITIKYDDEGNLKARVNLTLPGAVVLDAP